ncbi:carbamoyltransferase N-terminal domain-containing protein, partial [Halorubrum sp. SD626R]|uniref:carbamoyltransferase N-terminal domain-containing protein n=1 Tax=Halorubrum sp. SD626R TaxID=1419722 RepID=UPI0023BA107C
MVTQFLGFRPFHDEGKVMGLAPYGQPNEQIRSKLLREIELKADYDVTNITQVGGNNINEGVQRLEQLFGRQSKSSPTDFTQWEKDLAYVVQDILEEIILDIVRKYVEITGDRSVGVAGGIALNCKMNKRLREASFIEEFKVQPAAHDGGAILGAGALSY